MLRLGTCLKADYSYSRRQMTDIISDLLNFSDFGNLTLTELCFDHNLSFPRNYDEQSATYVSFLFIYYYILYIFIHSFSTSWKLKTVKTQMRKVQGFFLGGEDVCEHSIIFCLKVVI